jgi:F-type H+-transporting ATPase subunit delta
MTTRGAATRYARALLDVATSESIPERAEQDLARFTALLNGHPELQRALGSPAVPAARKQALTGALLSRLDVSGPVAKLLLMLADRDRLAIVEELLAVYRERLLDHQRVIRAELTTAEPLAPDQQTRLQERLARATGRQVRLSTRVDPSIIGGVVAKIGSVVYDGSLSTQLSKMRERLERQV